MAMSNWRVNTFLVLLVLLAGGIGYRLFYLFATSGPELRQRAEAQYSNQQESAFRRGDIFIGDFSTQEKTLVATVKDFSYIYAVPKEIVDQTTTRQLLVEKLGLTVERVDNIFSKKEDEFEVLIKSPTAEQVELVKQTNLVGVRIGSEPRRYYPLGEQLAQTIGFVGHNEAGQKTGQYGVEAYYDSELGGREGPADDLVLTIDKNIQTFAAQALEELVKSMAATGGSIIVQDPQTGEILAMVGSPSFDPNNYQTAKLSQFVNVNIQSGFEPGSTFKAITMSGALDKKALTPTSTYTDTGVVDIAGYQIKNFNEKSFGLQTMTQVLEKSLNTGAIYMEERLGDDNFLNYVLDFGFGQASGVDLAGEVGGDISNLYSKRKINFVTAAFGQGIAVTPLQLINSYSAIANGGKLMRPHIVKAVVHPDGSQTQTMPEIISTPISERSALTISKMLVDVVDHGFDKVRITGYDVAGKTGTAQIASPEGGYSDQFIHDMVAFAPAFAPKFVILIKLDKPQGLKFAADSLSPTMGKMTRFLLNYFNVPPSRE